jgi:hypothetical protein
MDEDIFWLTEAKRYRTILVRPEYIRMFGASAGVLLSQIVFWSRPNKLGVTKLRVVHDQRLWIAKHREDWMAETGLSLNQFKYALVWLRELGIVESGVWLFAGKTCHHVRLNVGQLADIMGGRLKINQRVGLKSTNVVGSKSTNGLVENQPTITEITTESTRDYTQTPRPEMKAREPKKSQTAQEVMEDARQHEPGSYVTLWKKRMSALHGEFVGQLKPKELAQLKAVVKIAGPRARSLIDYVCENWMMFAQKVKNVRGIELVPTEPHLGFLLTYVQVGLQLLVVTSDQPATPMKVSIAVEPTTKEIEEPHKMTFEEIAAELAEFDRLAAKKGGP